MRGLGKDVMIIAKSCAKLAKVGDVTLKKTALALLIVVLPAAAGQAHFLWVTSENGVYVVARGLPPDQVEPYDPGKVKEIKVFSREGALLPLTPQNIPGQAAVKVLGAPALVAVVCEWGYRVHTPEGKKFLDKITARRQGLKVEEAFFSIQYAKSIFASGTPLTKPCGLRFEIVPLKNPLELKPGEELPLQVIFDRQPLAGCRVKVLKGTDFLETDRNGQIIVKLPPTGWQAIYAATREPTPGRDDLDYRQHMTFLTFQRP